MPYERWKQSRLIARSDGLFKQMPQLFAGGYLLVSVLWILYSDKALVRIAGGFERYQELQTYKGWLFVAATSLLIFFVLRAAWRGIYAAYETSQESERRLHLALTSAGGGIWELDLNRNDETLAYVSEELIERLGLPPDYHLTFKEWRVRRHPDDGHVVDRRLQQAIYSGGKELFDARIRVRCEDGLYRWVHTRGNVVFTSDGLPDRVIGVALDIDEQVKAEERVSQLLRYDPATGLANQDFFVSQIEGIIEQPQFTGWIAIVQVRLLELDRLLEDAETIEDLPLIRSISNRLHALPMTLTARIATDVFAIAASSTVSQEEARRRVRDVLRKLLEPLSLPSGTVKLRVQVGGVTSTGESGNAAALLRNSGHALDVAERTTDIRVRWFDEQLGAEHSERNRRIQGLETAVRDGEIECHFQPLVDLKTGQTSGFEALARWHRKQEGLIQPDQFIGLAEEIGKIMEIGEEVLRKACAAATAWSSPYPFVGVNVSPLQLEDPTFPIAVARILGETGLSPNRLELEITENALPRDSEVAMRRISALRDLGVGVAIDDFGTGYSSLALLSKLPFTRLKIDRSFVSGSAASQQGTPILDMIVELAQNLGLSITAEGIETFDQAQMVTNKGVDVGQGFYFSKPVAAYRAGELVSRSWDSHSDTSATG